MTLLLPGLSPSLSLSLRRGIFLLNCAAIGSVLLYFNSEEEFTSSSSTSSSIEQTSKREKCKMHSTRLTTSLINASSFWPLISLPLLLSIHHPSPQYVMVHVDVRWCNKLVALILLLTEISVVRSRSNLWC